MNQKEKRQREINDLHTLMETQNGRRVARRILAHCGVFRSVYQLFDLEGREIPKEKTFYNAGKQDVGHWLTAELASANPGGYNLMNREHWEEAVNEENEARKKETEANG